MRRFSLQYFFLAAALQLLIATAISRARPHASTGSPAPPTVSGFPDLYEASIAQLQAGLESKQFTSVDLVKLSDDCVG